jgi:xanthine dehydrogenase small subunit
MGTIGGNIVNASPIGDFSILFLALNANINLNTRTIQLSKFFVGYKKLDLQKDEYVKSISFSIPNKSTLFNFEKVSKRTHLDIASVNSAIMVDYEEDIIKSCCISAGGVGPIPLYLSKTSEFLKGKTISSDTIIKANEVMQNEISPIGDVRGSIEYKRLLLRQLFFAHFIKLFPEKISLAELTLNSDVQ